MRHSPPEYNDYWLGSLRMAAGIILFLGTYFLVRSFLGHPSLGARVLGWTILLLTVVAGSFLYALGMAVIVKAAVRNA